MDLTWRAYGITCITLQKEGPMATFMNEMDVDDALRTHRDDRILGPAVRTLSNLRDCTNQNSDGWAYWPRPQRAAARLIDLIQAATRYNDPKLPTRGEVRKAYTPIRSFLTRHNLTCEIVEV